MIRDATRADIAQFYGAPAVPLDMLALVDGDEVLGVAGLAYCDDGVFAISSLAPVRDSIELVRLAILVLDKVEASTVPVYATRDPDEPTSDRCLRHLGFVPADGDLYEYRADDPGRFWARHAQRSPPTVSV